MKKSLSFILAFALCFGCFCFTAGADVNEDGYIEIYTIEDLYNVRLNLTANYILMNDIDLTEATAKGGDWDYGGRGWNPIGSNDIYSNGAFSGIFDGNGHSIIGMRINVTSLPIGIGSSVYVGLFANVAGTVKNLTITGGSVYYYRNLAFYVGSVAGFTNGTIENCHNVTPISGKASSIDKTGYVGGIVGYASSSAVIKNCSNKGTIKAETYTSTDDGFKYAGGIAGSGSSSAVFNKCYNVGAITATSHYYSSYSSRAYSSGISPSGKITDCYNAATVTATGEGYNYSYGIAERQPVAITWVK